MVKVTRNICIGVAYAFFSVMAAGCETMDQQSPLMNKQIANTPKDAGVIYLSIKGSQWQYPQDVKTARFRRSFPPIRVSLKRKKVTAQEIIIVKVNNDAGNTVAKLVMPQNYGNILSDALKRELSAAGYTVRLVRTMPKNEGKGIDISWFSTDLEQSSGLFSLKGSCDLHVKLDWWRNGPKFVSRDYASNVSDFSVTNQDMLLVQLLSEATQNITSQAVPDIINDFTALGK